MVIPIPNVSFNLSFAGRKKDEAKKDELATASEAPLQLNFTVDPVMLLMATALVLLSAALIVQAARS